MATASVDTGHGASVTFGTSSYSFNWTSINMGQQTRNDVSTTHLGTTGFETFIPGDLANAGEITIPFQFDAEASIPATSTAAETVTITLPQATGQTAAATYAGTGYVKSVTLPELSTDTIQAGEFIVKWDGETGPTFTAATTV